jgi:hypothetical protein
MANKAKDNSILWKRAVQIAALGRGGARGAILYEPQICSKFLTSLKLKYENILT